MTRPTLTTEAGAPVGDNQHSQTAGAAGPVLLQDHHLIEKLARFNRERIPERVVHAVGSGAHGFFEVTHDVTAYTKMKMLAEIGKRTEVFVRFSTVAASKGGPDLARDPRGFAVKFYTEDGNYNLVGNNTPVFFLRDGIKFPDFIHSQKYDPFTNRQEPNNVWDFFSHSPEATHQFVWLFGDRGRPASYRQMDGFGSHTFAWINDKGERFWVKYHLKTEQGIACMMDDEAVIAAGQNPEYLQSDLHDAIERGEHPAWSVEVQIMPEADAASYRFNPFDLTKVWSHADYPRHKVGRLVLDRNPDNYFAHVEQAAFDPAELVPGVGPSPDRMLQARLFAYGDAHRYRLGTNHTLLPVNAPRGVAGGARNYGRDGFMAFGANGGRSANYEPNSRGGPVETGHVETGVTVEGRAQAQRPVRHAEDDDFVQAGMLYGVMTPAERDRLVQRIAGSLAQVTLPGVVERSIGHFEKASAELGGRIREAVSGRIR